MKKIVIVGLALVAAVAAEAVQINWSTLTGANSFGAANSGNIVLLVRDSVTANTKAGLTLANDGSMTLASGLSLLGVGFLNANGELASVGIVQSAGNWSASGTLTVAGLANFVGTANAGDFPSTVTSTAAGASGKRDYYMIIFDKNNLDDATQMKQVKIANTSPALATANLALQFNGNNATAWEAVPEPTSIALLALGVAAIGLRRRFIK